jgi:response regulator RpfG family c-di-GMP phosphodiesterase
LPSLIIIDEKMLQKQAGGTLELIAGLYAIPAILLSVKADHRRPLEGIWEINKNYTFVSKPCRIEELKTAVEHLLQMNLNLLQE